MKEPFLSQFRELIRAGASSQDIHDATGSVGYAASRSAQANRFVEREVARVGAHQESLLPLLEHHVGRAPSILDVGCSSGGTTVALALSRALQASEIVGIDPNLSAIAAARVRAQGYDIEPNRLRFEGTKPQQPLPFADCAFELTTCVSVLEFISERSGRQFLTSELRRVTKPGGYIFVATPSPWRLREFHSGRFLGHLLHRDGYPWASTPWAIRRMFHDCEPVQIGGFVMNDILRRHLPKAQSLSVLSSLLVPYLPWQKHLYRKPRAQ